MQKYLHRQKKRLIFVASDVRLLKQDFIM